MEESFAVAAKFVLIAEQAAARVASGEDFSGTGFHVGWTV